MSSIIRDGAYDQVGGLETGIPKLRRPFEGNGDLVSLILERIYKQTPAQHLADKVAGLFAPGAVYDSEITDAWLVDESEPDATPTGLFQFKRTFARVPSVQTTYSSLPINKPAFPTNDFNGAWVDSTASVGLANVWCPVIATSAEAWNVDGGTYKITYGTDTATVNWNDSISTVVAAVNALPAVSGSGKVLGGANILGSTNQGFAFFDTFSTGTNVSAGLVFDFSGLTCSTAGATIISTAQPNFPTAYWQAFSYASSLRKLSRPSHGLSAAQPFRYSTSSTGGGTLTSVASVLDANNFTITNPSASTLGPIATEYRTILRTYTPGSDRVVVQLVDSFYLPGVSPGIVTPKDIPIADVAINDTQLLTLITNLATGFQVYDADALARWPADSSPIYTQRVKYINVDNL